MVAVSGTSPPYSRNQCYYDGCYLYIVEISDPRRAASKVTKWSKQWLMFNFPIRNLMKVFWKKFSILIKTWLSSNWIDQNERRKKEWTSVCRDESSHEKKNKERKRGRKINKTEGMKGRERMDERERERSKADNKFLILKATKNHWTRNWLSQLEKDNMMVYWQINKEMD